MAKAKRGRKRLGLSDTYEEWWEREFEKDNFPPNSHKAFLYGVATGRRWEKQDSRNASKVHAEEQRVKGAPWGALKLGALKCQS